MQADTASPQGPGQASPWIILLAAGRGERYRASGGTTHKLDAPIGDASVLQHTLAAVRASGLPWHLERGPHAGMGDSLAAAVRATSSSQGGWLVLPADLPLVLPGTLQAVARALMGRPGPSLAVVQPQFGGRGGHPVGFTAAAGPALMALSGDRGAATVLREAERAGQLLCLDTDDAGTVLDVDTVPALEQAERLWRQRQGLAC